MTRTPWNLRPWTPKEITIAADIWQRAVTNLHGDDDEWCDGAKIRAATMIARALKRTVAMVQNRRWSHGPSFRESETPTTGSMRASVRALAERDALYEARSQRDLTAQFFGDPPKGYSALDRRRP